MVTSTIQRSIASKLGSSAVVPILLYHYIGQCPQEDKQDLYRGDLWVTGEEFERQLQYLEHAGYVSISLGQLFARLQGQATLPARPAVLSFDDGQADNYTAAFPLLKKYKTAATFFVVCDLVGKRGYVTWDQLREMAEAGMAIESHTATHASLTSISSAELRRELESSREAIERRLGRPVRYLAYPGGHYNAAVLRATRAAGYQGAVTTLHGITIRRNAPFELPRVRVRSTDSIQQLAERVSGEEPWHYMFQRRMRRWDLWRPWKKTRKRVRRILGIRGGSN